MTSNPLLLLLMTAASVYLGRLWWSDLRRAEAGQALPHALPGAAPAPPRAWLLASLGSLVLLAAETGGELSLGLAGSQTRLTALQALYTLSAPVIEEIVFRGYLVIEGRGLAARRAGIVAASILFALLHPFLWQWDHGWAWTPTVKGVFSTAAVFASSLWFYAVRY
ncbi:MAG: type II CAAX prenyl endopeptidase Rce1 family protein, partial [Opitutales bacterium]